MAAVLDDVLCSLQFGGMKMDIGTTLLIGWALFCLFIVLLGVFIYNRHLRPRKLQQNANTASSAQGTTNSASEFSNSDAAGSRIGFGGNISNSSHGRSTPFARSGKIIQLATVTGIDKDAVDWTNKMLDWVYNDTSVSCAIVDMWVKDLNKVISTSNTEHGVRVTFEKLNPESAPPKLHNVSIEVSPKDEISLTCNAITNKMIFVVNTSRQKGDMILAPVYQATISGYAGMLKVSCNPHKVLASVTLADHPNLRIALKPILGHQGVEPLDEQALQAVLEEIITNALTNWCLELNFDQFLSCPVFKRPTLEAQPVKPIHYDSMTSPLLPPISPRSKKDKRLLVKVIKANNLGSFKGCQEPYCVIEIDEPPQKHQTTYLKDTSNPFWDEHFLFDLNNESTELLFELYDKAKPEKDAFLGLGIISVDDLLKNPSQRQIISLQTRPYENDEVSGSLTAEFLFVDATTISLLPEFSSSQTNASPVSKPRTETNRLVTPGGAVVTTTTTTISKPSSGTDVVANGGDPVTDTALRELENRQFVSTPPSTTTNKSTLIIHSVQREVVHPSVKVEKTKNGKFHEVTQPPPEVVVESDGDVTIQVPQVQPTEGNGALDSLASSISSKEDSGRSRPKDRRTFMNTLRKRFSFRNKRSKSMDPPGDGDVSGDESVSRSASADRARGTRKGIPGGPRVEVTSTHSSLSEASGVSESSTQTYLSEMSTLIIETIENGVTKHYLLPPSMANKSKWRKRGIKLHIFNDHIFVAKHFPGSVICQVCSKNIPRRIGKQGYECRDCHLRCHKMCHVKTDAPCPDSTVNMLELSYDEYTAASRRAGKAATPNGVPRRPLSIVSEE